MKNTITKITALFVVRLLSPVLRGRSARRIFAEALSVRHGLRVSEFRKLGLATNLICLAVTRWVMQSFADAADSPWLHRKLRRLDEELDWVALGYGILKEYMPGGRGGSADPMWDGEWWQFVTHEEMRFTHQGLQFFAAGPRHWDQLLSRRDGLVFGEAEAEAMGSQIGENLIANLRARAEEVRIH